MIEYKELIRLLTKNEELLEKYSELDSSLAADYLINDIEQYAHTTLEVLRILGQRESEAYEKTFEFLSGLEYFYYSNPIANSTFMKDVAEAIRLYKLGRIL